MREIYDDDDDVEEASRLRARRVPLDGVWVARRRGATGERDVHGGRATKSGEETCASLANSIAFLCAASTGPVQVCEQTRASLRFRFRIRRVVKVVCDGTKRAVTRRDNVLREIETI